MQLPHYSPRIAESGLQYRFTSVGPKGQIEKLVSFTPMELPGVYNLGFGDEVAGTGEIDDLVVSNNGDMDTVLTTVALIADDSMSKHPGIKLFMMGSTPDRTRLYQMAIGRNISLLHAGLLVFGMTVNGWEQFEKGCRYHAFYAVKKL